MKKEDKDKKQPDAEKIGNIVKGIAKGVFGSIILRASQNLRPGESITINRTEEGFDIGSTGATLYELMERTLDVKVTSPLQGLLQIGADLIAMNAVSIFAKECKLPSELCATPDPPDHKTKKEA